MGSVKRKMASLPVAPGPIKRAATEDHTSLPANRDQHEPCLVKEGGDSPSVTLSSCEAEKVQTRLTEQSASRPEPAGGLDSISRPLSVEDNRAFESGLSQIPSEIDEHKNDQESRIDPILQIDGCGQKGRDSVESSDNKLFYQRPRHLVPNHVGWFSWDKVHALEQQGLPEFFNGKSKVRTPALYIEYRNLIMKKYLENAEKLLTLADLSTITSGNREAGRRIFGFLDHWGLINHGAVVEAELEHAVDQAPTSTAQETEMTLGDKLPVPNLFENLFRFDSARAVSMTGTDAVISKRFSAPALVEATSDMQVGSQGPAVDYHCNSCSADCSKRRYHCQKQADFDLCPDCYNDAKFSFGMTKSDFILMEALPEAMDTNSSGWTDQETLLLLEALELCGDNWDMIAEHVATKTKAQCILHFIQLQIEDPFLESTESPHTLSTVSSAPDSTCPGKSSLKVEDHIGSSNVVSNEPLKQNLPDDGILVPAKINDEGTVDDVEGKNEELSMTCVINDAIQAAGLFGSDKSIPFSDAGNPVMALVAFLAALVGPDIAATSAKTALMVLSDQNPAVQLAAKNSFLLEASDLDDDITKSLSDSTEVGKAVASCEGTVAADGLSTTACFLHTTGGGGGGDGTSADTEGRIKEGDICAPSLIASAGATGTDKDCPQRNESSDIVNEDNRTFFVDKVKNAAATALAAAAVKAKFLADREEREILYLTAGVVSNQLKKLEIKLKLFRELEIRLRKECDQVEKARQRLLTDRAHLFASHLNPLYGQNSGPSATAFKTVSITPGANVGVIGSTSISTVGATVLTRVAPTTDSTKVNTVSNTKRSFEISSGSSLQESMLYQPGSWPCFGSILAHEAM